MDLLSHVVLNFIRVPASQLIQCQLNVTNQPQELFKFRLNPVALISLEVPFSIAHTTASS
jgi:hypothetical protein